jgi:hypothetical protein
MMVRSPLCFICILTCDVFSASSIMAGQLAAVVTHPADTIKTRMQANLGSPAFRTTAGTASHIISHDGFSALFSGLLPRAVRITCAVFILSECRDLFTRVYLERTSNLSPQT